MGERNPPGHAASALLTHGATRASVSPGGRAGAGLPQGCHRGFFCPLSSWHVADVALEQAAALGAGSGRGVAAGLIPGAGNIGRLRPETSKGWLPGLRRVAALWGRDARAGDSTQGRGHLWGTSPLAGSRWDSSLLVPTRGTHVEQGGGCAHAQLGAAGTQKPTPGCSRDQQVPGAVPGPWLVPPPGTEPWVRGRRGQRPAPRPPPCILLPGSAARFGLGDVPPLAATPGPGDTSHVWEPSEGRGAPGPVWQDPGSRGGDGGERRSPPVAPSSASPPRPGARALPARAAATAGSSSAVPTRRWWGGGENLSQRAGSRPGPAAAAGMLRRGSRFCRSLPGHQGPPPPAPAEPFRSGAGRGRGTPGCSRAVPAVPPHAGCRRSRSEERLIAA